METDEELFNLSATVYSEENTQPSTKTSTPEIKKRKRLHVVSPWTTEDTLTLISAVESHPCVWEYSSPEYKDRQKRDSAWRNIAESFGSRNVEECKAKWANIKTAYNSVKKKVTSTKSGQGVSEKPHWPFWSAMSFYFRHDCAKTTESVTNIEHEDSLHSSASNTAGGSLPKDRPALSSNQATKTPDELLKCAVELLNNNTEDQWTAFGTYLATQLRIIEERNKELANNLHVNILKQVMEVLSKINAE